MKENQKRGIGTYLIASTFLFIIKKKGDQFLIVLPPRKVAFYNELALELYYGKDKRLVPLKRAELNIQLPYLCEVPWEPRTSSLLDSL